MWGGAASNSLNGKTVSARFRGFISTPATAIDLRPGVMREPHLGKSSVWPGPARRLFRRCWDSDRQATATGGHAAALRWWRPLIAAALVPAERHAAFR